MDAFSSGKPNAGSPEEFRSSLEFDRLLEAFIFITSLFVAMVLINVSIDSMGKQTLVIGDRKPFEYTNKLRIKGMDFNRSSLMGTDNFYNMDYVVYGRPSTDFLKIAVGITYENGEWSSNPTIRFSYKGGIIPLETEGFEGNDTATVLSLTYFDGYMPTIDPPAGLSLLQFNFSERRGRYIEKKIEGCSFDETVDLFWTENTIKSWEKYQLRYYLSRLPENYTYVVSRHGDNRYTQLPEKLAEKLEVKTHYATKDASTDLEKIEGIIGYLREHYEFKWVWRDAPHDQDPVQWFLFNEGKGISIHFNSALVLMARSIDIPARVVGGYRLNPAYANFLAPMQRVVHAEVWCENVGWVRFDATPEPVYELSDPSRRTWIRISNKDKVEEEKDLGKDIPVTMISFGLIAFTLLVVLARIIDQIMVRRGVDEDVLLDGVDEVYDDRLVISFKEIEGTHPNVWDRNHPITIAVASQLLGALTLQIGGETLTPRQFLESYEITKEFELGNHLIKATLIGDKTGTVIESCRVLRVVEYKNEIVQMFNRILKDPSLAMNWWRLTAREIESLLRESYPNIPVEVLDRFTSLFEYADYSQYDVGRTQFIGFYEAMAELEEWIKDGEEE